MKRIGKYLIAVLILLIPISVFATETTEKLYIDIQIEEDGSLFVREIATLRGNYNGRLRSIEYTNPNLQKFTGKFSDFAGSDIYNASSITDLKVYDIKDKWSINFDSFNQLNRQFDSVSSASSGDYGVYEQKDTSQGVDLKIFNPSSYATAFYIEYRVKDAVVVHQDVAELYWNLLGNSYEENVEDFQVRVHLPGPDDDLRVWLHGPLYGNIERTSNALATVRFQDLEAYKPVSVRLMFDKSLVPNTKKVTQIAARDNILAYEQQEADKANAEREKLFQELVDDAKYYLDRAEEMGSLSDYNRAEKLINSLKESEEKTELMNRLPIVRAKVEIQLEKDVKFQIENVKQEKNHDSLNELQYRISLLQEGPTKENFKNEYLQLKIMVEEHLEKMQTITVGIFIGWILLIGLLIYISYLKHNKKIETGFHQQYYRDFPAEYSPGVLEYLMKKKITTNTFSATILDLIRKKVIKVEESSNSKTNKKNKNYTFLKQDTSIFLSKEEQDLIHFLFVIIGKNGTVTLNELKNYGNSEMKARHFIKEYNEFVSFAKESGKAENFYQKMPIINIIAIIFTIVGAFFMIVLLNKFEMSSWIFAIILLAIVFPIYIGTRKYRTQYGKTQYEMWKAHKNFLLDFGRFQEKELPDIKLWERYLVTATILGCAKEVQKSMQIHLEKMENIANGSDIYYDMSTIYTINHLLDSDFSNNVSASVQQAVSHSRSTIASANSSSSSGGGFGGGSSGGGGFGGGGGGGGRF